VRIRVSLPRSVLANSSNAEVKALEDFWVNIKRLFDLSGRVAIVTGGSIGLGRQMAEGLAEMGANVVLCARKKERCEQTAEELRQLGAQTLALGCDVRDANQIAGVVEATISRFERIDILINNAGTSWGAPIEEMRLEHWNKVIETNLTSTFLFSQAVGRFMVPQHRGKIINIASVAGLRGASPELQAIGYHASKGGVIAFRTWLASGARTTFKSTPSRRGGSRRTCPRWSLKGTRKHF
jgi:gluconate 5-dehydrogenase